MRRFKIGARGSVVIAGLAGAAIAFAAVQLARPVRHPVASGVIQGAPQPTLANPLDAPAKQMTLAAAESALGVSVPLPNTSAVRPADLGAVWEGSWTYGTSRTLALTYPSQGFIIYFHQPAPPVPDLYQREAAEVPSAQVIQLNGTTPAFVAPQNSDTAGTNFGVVAFSVDGTNIEVRGHTDLATLEDIAQSLLTQWPSTASSTSPGTSRSPKR